MREPRDLPPPEQLLLPLRRRGASGEKGHRMSAEIALEPLPTVRAADLRESATANRWLVEGLWTRAAVGFIGGVPKLGKTWLGLDLAVSVASGTDCLGPYPVSDPGDTLVYLAEDHPAEVRQRIACICR